MSGAGNGREGFRTQPRGSQGTVGFLGSMRTAPKLLLAFGVTFVLMAVVGALGFRGMGAIRLQLESICDVRLPSVDLVMEAGRDLEEALVAERSMIYADAASDQFKALLSGYERSTASSAERMSAYRSLDTGGANAALYEGYLAALGEWQGISRRIVDGRTSDTREGRRLAIDLSLAEGAAAFDALRARLDAIAKAVLADAAAAKESALRVHSQSVLMLVIVVVIGFAVGAILAAAITASITVPLRRLSDLSEQIAGGKVDVAQVEVTSRDEVGMLAASFGRMVESLRDKGRALDTIARGDLTGEVPMASAEDELGRAMVTMQRSVRDFMVASGQTVAQVSTGAEQVAQSSQALSQGATEQASSLEEVSSAVTEINGQARQNAESATQANALAKVAAENAGKGNDQMQRLAESMVRIDGSARQIGKVVKLIDDIAFQINLLALNANVEAARAGKYGKGFAVVAEEVRALAVRSAAAVKETTTMVEEASKSIGEGTRAAESTRVQLGEIVSSVTRVTAVLAEIAAASERQARGVEQVNAGLGQVEQVTQANTASAEQSAAAAEELSSQAQQLGELIRRYTVVGSSPADSAGRLTAARRLEAPSVTGRAPSPS
jgi:methyl-accepting chemotaxis protein